MAHTYKEHKSNFFSEMYLALKKKEDQSTKKKKVIVIAGPTGVGKTKMSIAIAKIIGGEIISADSMQIYKGMDIGTAKATAEERALVPHHLIDICHISDSFNVVEFYNRANCVCQDILLREKVPIVVGGSGFYIHSLLYGPPQGPPSIFEVRQELERQMEEMGPEVLYERLQMIDPDYAMTITENDRHKIVRALEIISITKRPVSELPKAETIQEQYDYRCWFLYFPKDSLYPRIELRCEEMLEKGFIEEVEKLEKEGLRENHSASQAIGYRQCLEFLKTSRTLADRERFISDFKKATRHYVKRQFTWFRKEPYFRFVDLSEIEPERAIEYILQDYEQG